MDDIIPLMLDERVSRDLLSSLTDWPRPTFEQVRHLVLEHEIITPMHKDEADGRKKLFAAIPDGFLMTIRSGRVFDLGHMPNEVIAREAKRGCKLYLGGHIGHPFSEPYLLYHTWEGGGSLLLVDPLDWHAHSGGHYPPGTAMICEAQPTTARGRRFLMIGDLAFVKLDHDDGRYMGFVERCEFGDMVGDDKKAATLGNLAEPVMAALLLLATDGVAVDRVEPSPKLNKARAKARKPAIPAHWRVATADYVTALSQRGKRRQGGEAQGGHHASPIPHLRRGHIRNLSEYHGGGERWIRDALVMIKDDQEIGQLRRSFYSMQRSDPRQERPMAETRVETVELSQHNDDGIYGDVVTLQTDGTFAISKFDGITVLTAEQADRIAAMLMRWAAKCP